MTLQQSPSEPEHYRFVFKHYRIHPLSEALVHYKRGKDKKTGAKLSHWTPVEHGGRTECYVYDDYGIVVLSSAECSVKDAFCYRTGRLIAKGRATTALAIRNGVAKHLPKYTQIVS